MLITTQNCILKPTSDGKLKVELCMHFVALSIGLQVQKQNITHTKNLTAYLFKQKSVHKISTGLSGGKADRY